MSNPRMMMGLLSPEHRDTNLPLIRAVKEIADEKGVTLSQLALAWSLAKYDNVQSLIGTTNPEHHTLTVHVFMLGIGLTILSYAYGGIQSYSLYTIPFLLLYSGKRGKLKMKSFFYIFYPAHLVVLECVSQFI